jgi:transcriptional regulator with XRE-family HTH domain
MILEADYNVEDIGAVITEIRLELGVSKEQLAKECGFDLKALTNVEAGVSKIGFAMLHKIVSLYDFECTINLNVKKKT